MPSRVALYCLVKLISAALDFATRLANWARPRGGAGNFFADGLPAYTIALMPATPSANINNVAMIPLDNITLLRFFLSPRRCSNSTEKRHSGKAVATTWNCCGH